jgi:hypothetical protein
VSNVDFQQQLADKNREAEGRPSKRFRSSAAPKGSVLPTNYQDRAKLRNSQSDDAKSRELETQIKALAAMVTSKEITQDEFDRRVDALGVGGDLESTHMVKGLDMKLVQRIRAGEDVSQPAEHPEPPPQEEDADEAFEHLTKEDQKNWLEELAAAPKQHKEKKQGIMPPPAAKPKSRNDYLKEMLEARRATPKSILGTKFKKLGDGKPKTERFEETDKNGQIREVIIITDAEGNTKRMSKLKKPNPPVQEPASAAGDLLMPDKNAKPLGMEVPTEISARAAMQAVPEDEDEDIFAGAGDDYNPLAGIEDDGSSSDEDGEVVDSTIQKPKKASVSEEENKPVGEIAPAKPRNYFGTSTTAEEKPKKFLKPFEDPAILAALKHAADLAPKSTSGEGIEDGPTLRQKQFMEEVRRRDAMDAADMDMGFGGSRNEDGAEEDQGPLLDFDDDKRGGQKRKRGPKKKKGDKNSASDVMRVVEGRKKDAS